MNVLFWLFFTLEEALRKSRFRVRDKYMTGCENIDATESFLKLSVYLNLFPLLIRLIDLFFPSIHLQSMGALII